MVYIPTGSIFHRRNLKVKAESIALNVGHYLDSTWALGFSMSGGGGFDRLSDNHLHYVRFRNAKAVTWVDSRHGFFASDDDIVRIIGWPAGWRNVSFIFSRC